jgi:hypothetical protein
MGAFDNGILSREESDVHRRESMTMRDIVLTTGENSLDGFIAKYEYDGTLAWARHVEGSSRDIFALPDGSFLLTGYFAGTAAFGPGESNRKPLKSAGGYDVFVMRLNPWHSPGRGL